MGLICLDVDGTLVADALVEDDGKLQRPQDQLFSEPRLLEGRWDVLYRAAGEGDTFALVTNQGGVAWGYHTQAEVRARLGRVCQQLEFFWGQPFSVHVAWGHPRATLPQFRVEEATMRRKPQPTMILDALTAHGEIQANALMVGNHDVDREAAEKAGIDFALAGDFFSF